VASSTARRLGIAPSPSILVAAREARDPPQPHGDFADSPGLIADPLADLLRDTVLLDSLLGVRVGQIVRNPVNLREHGAIADPNPANLIDSTVGRHPNEGLRRSIVNGAEQ
jgi:hypothetical protein